MANKLNLGRVKGTNGVDGAPGAAGKSAYQAAVEKGYTGTEEEFNTALAGMKDGPFFPAAGGDVAGLNVTGSLTTDGDITVDLKGCLVQGVNAPAANTDAANKAYVDGKTVIVQNLSILPSAWVSGSYSGGYSYSADIALPWITDNYVPMVCFAPLEATGGNFAPFSVTGNGFVKVYAKAKPSSTVIIPSIVFFKNG